MIAKLIFLSKAIFPAITLLDLALPLLSFNPSVPFFAFVPLKHISWNYTKYVYAVEL